MNAPHPQADELPGWPPEIEKGSALDFSGLLDGPAGKHGPLVVSEGKFVFAKQPDRPVRFYGVNLSSSANFLDRKTCRQLAERLAASGYNSVRIHHHDRTLTANGNERATEIDPVEMDKLDYLFYCCKELGIYLTTDLFVSRMPKEIFPELGRAVKNWEEFKFLIHLLEDARKNWEEFSRNFLNHVNPYTGLAWKDDPALITLSMVNEDAIYHCYKNATPDVRSVYDRHFDLWLEKRQVVPENDIRRTALLNLFLFEICGDSFTRMKAFVRSLGCRTLITDQNHWSILPMALLRRECDYVDDHFYWDHPEAYALPSKLLNTSSLSDLAGIFSGIFPGRCFGKPYTISEFNWVYPNQYRAESAPLTAAYAALQDWDGLWRYSYAHSSAAISGDLSGSFFDIHGDPINSLSDRIGILLFLRGDVQSSSLRIPFAVSSGHMQEADPRNTYPDEAWKLGFVGQIGTVVEREGKLKLPKGTRACLGVDDSIQLQKEGLEVPFLSSQTPHGRVASLRELCDFEQGILDGEGKAIRSTTGELELNEKAGTFLALTARSEVMAFNRSGEMKGRVLSVQNAGGPSVFCASSLDGRSLGESKRILVLHLTNAIHEDTLFRQNVVEKFGAGPGYRVTPGCGELTFQFSEPHHPSRVWALDLSGKRIGEITASPIPAPAFSFSVNTEFHGRACFLYEVVR